MSQKNSRGGGPLSIYDRSLCSSFVPGFEMFSGWTEEIIIEPKIKGLSLLCLKGGGGGGLKRARRWWKDPVFTAPPLSTESTVSPILMYLLSRLPLAFHSTDPASIYIALLRNPLEWGLDRPRLTGPLIFALSHHAVSQHFDESGQEPGSPSFHFWSISI